MPRIVPSSVRLHYRIGGNMPPITIVFETRWIHARSGACLKTGRGQTAGIHRRERRRAL